MTQADWDRVLLFWTPLAEPNEWLRLKASIESLVLKTPALTKIRQGMSIHDVTLEDLRMDLCEKIKAIFPGYYISEVNRFKTELDFAKYKLLCCATMILYGVISARLSTNPDIQLLFKGGRAIQMGKETMSTSEDIDLWVDAKDAQNTAGHLALLMRLLLPFSTSVLPPRDNSFVYKISYQASDHRFMALSDIDFKPIDHKFFNEVETTLTYLEDLQQPALFRRPTLEMILQEKVFFYEKYRDLADRLEKGEPAEVDLKTCHYFMDKFGKAILSIDPQTYLRLIHLLPTKSKSKSHKSRS